MHHSEMWMLLLALLVSGCIDTWSSFSQVNQACEKQIIQVLVEDSFKYELV